MKKIFYFITILFFAAGLSSCNKKAKEDLDELEKSIEEQKSKNQALENTLGELNSLLLNAPMSFTLTTNDRGSTLALSGSYSFVYGAVNSYSSVTDNNDGTYKIYVWRGNDLGTDYYVETEFTYNPSTNQVSNATARLEGYLSNGNAYDLSFEGSTDINQTITVNSFSYEGGTISFTYAANTTNAYADNIFGGQSMSFSAGYTGGIAKRKSNDNAVVSPL
ncbi:MAG: hypothetical protein MUF42_07955 [Cytophagaceae bacterium]|jgi:hypothetical protein|nr:hypothetical protein [Cytophagaceae bacterium]